MAGMARAMGATLTEAKNCLAQIKTYDLRFLEPLFWAPYNN